MKQPPETIPNHLRCNRNDGKQWRCSGKVMEGKKFCEPHHLQALHRLNKSQVPSSLLLSSTKNRKKRQKNPSQTEEEEPPPEPTQQQTPSTMEKLKLQKQCLKVGDEVEITSHEFGFYCSWYTGTILRLPKGRGYSYLVEYHTLMEDEETKKPLRELINAFNIRPKPPLEEGERVFKQNDEIDAYLNDGWWEGVILKVIEEEEERYRVYFPDTKEEMEFGKDQLRRHMDWVDGSWTRSQVMATKAVQQNQGEVESPIPTGSTPLSTENTTQLSPSAFENNLEKNMPSSPGNLHHDMDEPLAANKCMSPGKRKIKQTTSVSSSDILQSYKKLKKGVAPKTPVPMKACNVRGENIESSMDVEEDNNLANSVPRGKESKPYHKGSRSLVPNASPVPLIQGYISDDHVASSSHNEKANTDNGRGTCGKNQPGESSSEVDHSEVVGLRKAKVKWQKNPIGGIEIKKRRVKWMDKRMVNVVKRRRGKDHKKDGPGRPETLPSGVDLLTEGKGLKNLGREKSKALEHKRSGRGRPKALVLIPISRRGRPKKVHPCQKASAKGLDHNAGSSRESTDNIVSTEGVETTNRIAGEALPNITDTIVTKSVDSLNQIAEEHLPLPRVQPKAKNASRKTVVQGEGRKKSGRERLRVQEHKRTGRGRPKVLSFTHLSRRDQSEEMCTTQKTPVKGLEREGASSRESTGTIVLALETLNHIAEEPHSGITGKESTHLESGRRNPHEQKGRGRGRGRPKSLVLAPSSRILCLKETEKGVPPQNPCIANESIPREDASMVHEPQKSLTVGCPSSLDDKMILDEPFGPAIKSPANESISREDASMIHEPHNSLTVGRSCSLDDQMILDEPFDTAIKSSVVDASRQGDKVDLTERLPFNPTKCAESLHHCAEENFLPPPMLLGGCSSSTEERTGASPENQFVGNEAIAREDEPMEEMHEAGTVVENAYNLQQQKVLEYNIARGDKQNETAFSSLIDATPIVFSSSPRQGNEVAVPQSVPFIKSSPLLHLWENVQSMITFYSTPQQPHFRRLEQYKEELREGIAIGYMAGFANLVEKTRTLTFDEPQSSLKDKLVALDDLEELGFIVHPIRSRIQELLNIKARYRQLEDGSKSVEKQMIEEKFKDDRLEAEIDELRRKVFEINKMLQAITREKNMTGSSIGELQKKIDVSRHDIQVVRREFDHVVAAPW